MKLEVGKFYKTRDGRKVGPISYKWRGGEWHKFEGPLFSYGENGGVYSTGEESPNDLIAEWTDELEAAPAIEVTLTRAGILDEAKRCVTQDRQATHGKPEDTFGMIARVWSAKLGVEVTAAQVCLMLADLKICRAWGNPAHKDNWVDLAGYAACGGELAK